MPDITKGCTDANTIRLQATSNTNSFVADAYIYCYPGDYQFDPLAYPFRDSIYNLSADTYGISYTYTTRTAVSNYLYGMSNIGCDVISQTIVVPPYQQPLLSKTAVASCGTLRNVALLADSSRGVSPYLYQISSGAAATSLQSSPVFQNLSAGTYPFLIADACGNSYSTSIAVDTLVVPQPAVIGSLCTNNVASLRLTSNPYISYQWKLPSGSTVTGDSIYLNPVSIADMGTYMVTATSNIAGCTDSQQIAFNVQSCIMTVLATSRVRFTGERQGGNMVLQWQMDKDASVDHFIVERSANGIRFDALQNLSSDQASGNIYKVTDHKLLPGVSYYRLKIVHIDGLVTYSSIVRCMTRQVQKPEVYPTLITPGASLLVIYPAAAQRSYVQIISIDGKLQFTRQLPAGTTYTSIDVSTLAPGPYLVAVTYNGIKTVVKVLKQ